MNRPGAAGSGLHALHRDDQPRPSGDGFDDSTTKPLSIEVRLDAATGTIVVAPTGEIDLSTNHELDQALVDAVHSRADTVVVDLRDVSFLNTTGIGTLVSATRAMRERNGDLLVRGLRSVPRLAASAIGVDQYLHIED